MSPRHEAPAAEADPPLPGRAPGTAGPEAPTGPAAQAPVGPDIGTPAGPAAEARALLRRAVDRHGLVLPRYDTSWIGAILPALADAVGAGADIPGAAEARRALGVPAVRRVCVVLVDGLGEAQLAERGGHAPFLRTCPRTVLTAGFPSTTVASLASLGTGLPPGRTGLAGYALRGPGEDRVSAMIAWASDVAPRDWQVHPTVFEQVAARGVSTVSVGQSRYAGSALTEAALRGPRHVGADAGPARVEATLRILADDGPGIVYLYWGELDKIGHRYGWSSARWADALSELDRAVRRLAENLPPDTAMVLTADHGMVDTAAEPRWDVAGDERLARGVHLVGGEARAVHLYCEDPADVVDRWRAVLGDHALVLTRDQATAAGLFGVVEERITPILGDVIVAMTGRATVVDSRVHSAGALAMIGQHGSLTAPEMQVPWIVHAAR